MLRADPFSSTNLPCEVYVQYRGASSDKNGFADRVGRKTEKNVFPSILKYEFDIGDKTFFASPTVSPCPFAPGISGQIAH
ncbi:MAG: hypothetical protein A2Z99_03805 [Treponema sp. GWB1_62_6]|nr:MAG: hypothetical protein A2Z99_03805 [Treponema sp. GWB1_62_6]